MWVSSWFSCGISQQHLFLDDFSLALHLFGEGHEGEWRVLLNLIGLLFGFAILANISKNPSCLKILPKYLPDDWKADLSLLVADLCDQRLPSITLLPP